MPGNPSRETVTSSVSVRSHLRHGVTTEFTLLRHPQALVATLALIFVPALYVIIYVASVWDPYGKLSQLPAAFVSLDTAVDEAGKPVCLGDQIFTTLQRDRPFAFVRFSSTEAAQESVRRGKSFLALIVPKDFTRHAIRPVGREMAPLQLYVSEGSNYTGTVISRRFGAELAHIVNEQINAARWQALFGVSNDALHPTLREGVRQLHDGADRLAAGAKRVERGAEQLRDGAAHASGGGHALAAGSVELAKGAMRMSDGLRKIQEAVNQIGAQLPRDDQLHELAKGSADLSAGSTELQRGLVQLVDGSGRLVAGAEQLKEGSARVPIVGKKIAAGGEQLREGGEKIHQGLEKASDGARRLSEGQARLDAAIQPLAAGLIKLNAGLSELAARLPDLDTLAKFEAGASRVRDGNGELAEGLSRLSTGAQELQTGTAKLVAGAEELDAGIQRLDTELAAHFDGADPERLAAPVETVTAVHAPVPSNGAALAPYFASLALWIGAVMMSFVFHLRRLPETLLAAPRPVRWLAKAPLLLVIGAAQATVITGVCVIGFKIPCVSLLAVWSAALLGSATFVCVVLTLMALLGDAGRLLAVILLIFQLAASGGVYPVELSPPFFQQLHALLPFTALVHAFRATMFSAFEGNVSGSLLQLAATAAGAALIGMFLARWKFVPVKEHGPAVDLS